MGDPRRVYVPPGAEEFNPLQPAEANRAIVPEDSEHKENTLNTAQRIADTLVLGEEGYYDASRLSNEDIIILFEAVETYNANITDANGETVNTDVILQMAQDNGVELNRRKAA